MTREAKDQDKAFRNWFLDFAATRDYELYIIEWLGTVWIVTILHAVWHVCPSHSTLIIVLHFDGNDATVGV
jgi:hypothetical protein